MGEKKFKPIGTKLEQDTHEYFVQLCRSLGITTYSYLQIVIDAFIKSCCKAEPISEHTQRVLDKYSDIVRAKYGFSFAPVNLPPLEMHNFLAFIETPKKAIPEIVLIEKNDAGEIMQNRNSDAILRAFMKAFAPTFLNRLEIIQEQENLHSLADTLKLCINSYINEDTLHMEIRQLFADNDWVEYYDSQNNVAGYKKQTQETRCKRTRNNKVKAPVIDPEDIADPLQDIEHEIDPNDIADPLQDFEPDFDPNDIADPLQDFEPEIYYDPEE